MEDLEQAMGDGKKIDSEQGRGGASWKRDAWTLAVLLVVFLASRILWIQLQPESVSYWEEDYRWASAMEILAGPIQPLLDYQADHYQGGSLVVIALLVGSFGLFGESMLASKAPALLFASGTLVALFVLCRVFFDRSVALLAGGLYIAGPPLLAYSSLLIMGSHGESALFSALQIFIFLGLLDGRFRTRLGWLGFGFVSGLGIWFCSTSGVSLLACGLTWLLLARTPRPNELGAAVAGGLLGLLPWIAFNLQNDFVGLMRLFELFGGGDPIDAWEGVSAPRKLFLFFARDLPTGLAVPFAEAMREPWATLVKAGLYLPGLAALGLSLAGTIRFLRTRGLRSEPSTLDPADQRARSEIVFWVYGALILAVFLGSSFVIQPDKGAHTYRLFLPAVTLMIVPIASSAARALRMSPPLRVLASALMASFFMASLSGGIAVAARKMDEPDRRTASDHRMRGYVARGVLIHRKYEDALDLAFGEARRVPDLQLRFRVFQGIGWGIQYRYEGSGGIRALFPPLDEFPQGERVAVLSGLRWTTGERVDELREKVAGGQASPRDVAQLERLERLRSALDARWERVPLHMRMNDRVIY